jgi:hypothetical protein
MATLKNTTVAGTGHLQIPYATTSQRPAIHTAIVQWTNTGSQSSSVLAGPTPTLTNTSWTAPAGVTSIELLAVAGGGGGGSDLAGGGGAGGLIYNSAFAVTPGTTYTVTVGAGGLGGQAVRQSTSVGTNGSNSVFNNLITNGTFVTDTTGWSSPGTATLSVASGAIRVTNLSTNGRAQSTAFTTIPGRSYIASVTGVNRTAANYYFEIRSGVESSDSWTSGAVQRTFTAVQTTTYIELYAIGGAGVTADYDNISVSEVGSTAIGGGGGGAYWGSDGANDRGRNGGSGGGGGARDTDMATSSGQATPGQGFNGGVGGFNPAYSGGGGGGAGGPGSNGVGASYHPGGGGPGLAFNISGITTWYAGGGGGSNYHASNLNSFGGAGGIGGGGAGGYNITSPQRDGVAGVASTGGGGGGGSWTGSNPAIGGTGGSGIVIIRYSVTSDNNPSIGITRFNTESRQLEVYQGTYLGWVGQDTSRNFAGHNLFTFSSTFTNASWLANNSTTASSATISPDGSSGVFTAIPSVDNTTHQLYHQTGVTVTAVPYTFSIHVKANGYTQVRLADVSTGNGVWFNVSAGTIGSATAGFTGRIIDLGNGWYRCAITFTPSAGSQNYGIYLGNTTESTSFAGNGTSGLFVWGAQLEQSASAGPYVKTAGAASPIPVVLNGYRTHTYTSTGTSGFTAANTGVVEVLVVGAGGAGRTFGGGGGGGGGVMYQTAYAVVSGQAYTVFVGTGGAPGAADANGENSQFASLIAVGGGAPGADNYINGRQGGSGGGAGTYGSIPFYGAPGINGQGFGGGHNLVNIDYSGGGGGAGGPGRDAYSNGNGCGVGGPGVACSISGTLTFYGGGGGGAPRNSGSQSPGAPGGIGGGGAGSTSATSSPGVSGTANTGGGGGGGVGYPSSGTGGSGGSGIVIVRYRYD